MQQADDNKGTNTRSSFPGLVLCVCLKQEVLCRVATLHADRRDYNSAAQMGTPSQSSPTLLLVLGLFFSPSLSPSSSFLPYLLALSSADLVKEAECNLKQNLTGRSCS
jgi:hypothetical protein